MVAMALGGFAADYAFNVGLSRFLPPHEYGDFRVAAAFAALLGTLVLLGGDRAAPKALAGPLERGDSARAWEYLRFYLDVALMLSMGVIAVTWLLSFLHVGTPEPGDHHALAFAVLSVPVSAAGALASRGLQSARHPTLAALPWRLGIPLGTLTLVVAVAWVSGGIGVEQAVLLAVVTACLIAAWQWWELRRRALPELVRNPDYRTPRRWLATSMPMMGAFLVALALNQSDLYFLELLGDEHEVGLYGAAATSAHVLLMFQTALVGLIAPVVQPALDEGPAAARRAFRQGQLLMAAVVLPAAALLALTARPVLAAFGPSFPEAVPELRWLVLGNVAWALAALAVLWLQYTGRGLTLLTITAATLVLDSGLNVVLVPRYGMLGAAASTAFTTALAAAAVVWALVRRPSKTPDNGD